MRRKRLGDAFIEGVAGTRQTARWDDSTENIFVSDPLGNKTSLSFDNAGFPARVVTPSGRSFEFRNNTNGQPEELITPSGLRVEMEYDDRNRLARVTRDKKRYLAVEYDSTTQQPSRVWAPTGPQIALEYMSPQHLAGTTDRLGRRTSLEYGEKSELTALVDAAGNRTSFEYRKWNLPEIIRYPDGSVEERQFDTLGRLAAVTIEGVGLVSVTYDDEGHPLEQTYSDGEVVSYGYDGAGRVTTVANSQGTVKFDYDEDGRQTREETNGVVVQYDYDECGMLSGLTYPSGEQVRFRRDADLRVTQVEDWSGGLHRLHYESKDAGHTHIRPNGVVERVENDIEANPRRITAFSPAGHGGLFSIENEFDDEGNLVAISDSEFGRFTCEYDVECRLTSVKSDEGFDESFTYDAADNRTSKNGISAKYDPTNRLLNQGLATYRYDQRGNLIVKLGPDGVWQYDWNARNQLVRVHTPSRTVVEFGYDGLGRRLWKRVENSTVRYTWALECLIEEETTGHGAPSLRQYLYWPFSPTPFGMRCDGRDYQIHTDHLGAPQRMTDGMGRIAWDRRPCPTGEFKTKTHDFSLDLRFPGQMFDQETGLYYNRHRYYSPDQGRYISRDPVSFVGGVNLYCYAENNPTSNADPLGLWTTAGVLSVVGKTCGVIAGVAAGIAVGILLPGPVGIILGGAVAGAIINGSFYLMDNKSKPMCWPCLLKSMAIGAAAGAAAAVPFLFLPAAAGVAAFAGAGAASGGIGYTADWALSPSGTPWDWGAFGVSVGIGTATAGMGRWLGPKVGSQAAVAEVTAAKTPLAQLQGSLDNLAEKHLLPQFRALDPNLEAGYTGSFKTGTVGNPNKATFGQPINLNKFDIDYWIKSDTLFKKFGSNLKANPEFRKILSETPGFEGLKPNKEGFSIKFKPSGE